MEPGPAALAIRQIFDWLCGPPYPRGDLSAPTLAAVRETVQTLERQNVQLERRARRAEAQLADLRKLVWRAVHADAVLEALEQRGTALGATLRELTRERRRALGLLRDRLPQPLALLPVRAESSGVRT